MNPHLLVHPLLFESPNTNKPMKPPDYDSIYHGQCEELAKEMGPDRIYSEFIKRINLFTEFFTALRSLYNRTHEPQPA